MWGLARPPRLRAGHRHAGGLRFRPAPWLALVSSKFAVRPTSAVAWGAQQLLDLHTSSDRLERRARGRGARAREQRRCVEGRSAWIAEKRIAAHAHSSWWKRRGLRGPELSRRPVAYARVGGRLVSTCTCVCVCHFALGLRLRQAASCLTARESPGEYRCRGIEVQALRGIWRHQGKSPHTSTLGSLWELTP